jgi:triacylglycerol lipase
MAAEFHPTSTTVASQLPHGFGFHFAYVEIMPSFQQYLLLTALPVVGVSVFWYSWLLELGTSFYSTWSLSPISSPEVRLSQGLVIGTVLDNKFPAPIEAFMGLPYAQAPTGERRFRRAVSLPHSDSTFESKSYGPM